MLIKQVYAERLHRTMAKEMRGVLWDLIAPCDCHLSICEGWRIKTMIKAELPAHARVRALAEKL